MCFEFCRNTPIGFSNIYKNSFNNFDKAMDYMKNIDSKPDCFKTIEYMLSKQIARTLKTCPKRIQEAAMETARKFDEIIKQRKG